MVAFCGYIDLVVLVCNQMKSLFDQIIRTDLDASFYSEPDFKYLNRTARSELIGVRDLLESYYGRYLTEQPSEALRLYNEFRSDDPTVHYNAVTELWVYQKLREEGFSIKVHQELSNRKRPDFLCSKDDVKFFVEVTTLVSSPEYDRIEKAQKKILDTLDKMELNNLLISASFITSGDREPSYNNLKYFLNNHVKDHGNSASNTLWEYEGWKIRFGFVHAGRKLDVIKEAREEGRIRNIGSVMHSMRPIDLDVHMKNKADGKAKYGITDIPMVLVMNVVKEGMYCDQEMQLSALFGRLCVTVGLSQDGSHYEKPGRTLDGIWAHPKRGLRNRRIGAIWFLRNLNVFNVHEIESRLWLHPDAYQPFSEGHIKAPTMVLDKTTSSYLEKSLK